MKNNNDQKLEKKSHFSTHQKLNRETNHDFFRFFYICWRIFLFSFKIELFFQVHQKTNAHKLAEYHNRMLKEIDYKNDDDAKPPYSYAALICLSMKDTKKKMTLSQIYKWIRDNFAYYRKADKSWQVRKRHLLHTNR